MAVKVWLSILAWFGVWAAGTLTGSDRGQMAEVGPFLEELFQVRAQYLVNGDDETLAAHYDTNAVSSTRALAWERQRRSYIQAWAEKRRIRFVGTESRIRIARLKVHGDQAKLSLVHSVKLDYAYLGSTQTQWFGVGTRHAMTLKKTADGWHVLREWYSDPFDETPDVIEQADERFPHIILENQKNENRPAAKTNQRFDRERAVSYANKYAGVAWGAGNGNRYNRKYRDYTPQGGDCTNFVSQAIGDREEGGRMRMTPTWQYWMGSGGSHSWVQTDRFKHFLLHSGYVRHIATGTFAEVTTPTARFPMGAIAKLEPGDLIAYILHGNDVDHFTIVTGHDDFGYPLVNSHTADRYRMPFDLGWSKTTKYMLIHIVD